MSLILIHDDITHVKCDVIVNATNQLLFPGGKGVDARIHAVAGPELLKECVSLDNVQVGHVVMTDAYNLPCKKIFHTVGPIWEGGKKHEKELLQSCYTEALKLAEENHFESIAFPLISSGAYGYPKKKVIRVATDTIFQFLLASKTELTVYLVVFDKDSYEISEKLFHDVQAFIGDEYENDISKIDKGPSQDELRECNRSERIEAIFDLDEILFEDDFAAPPEQEAKFRGKKEAPSKESVHLAPNAAQDLSQFIQSLDVSFSKMLTTLIDLKGLSDVECYKKANVSRQTWHKIISDKHYTPSKNTVLSFAIVLKLTYEETQALLKTVGMTLSNSLVFDTIITFFLLHKKYDLFEIEETLLKFDQPTLSKY